MQDLSRVLPRPGAPTPRVLRVNLIGDFAVVNAGLPVHIQQGGQRVLALLGLSRRPLPRSRIAGTLWPASPAAQASANLRAALTRLPRPGGLLLTSNGNADVGLSDDVEVDVWICDAAIGQLQSASAHLPEDPPPDRITNEALDMLDGDVLPLWEDDWVLVERERHRQARLHALERLSTTLRQAGRFEEALQAALAAVAGESLRESAHRHVIEIHLAEGNQAEALRQYEIYRRILRAELGLSPSVVIRELVRALLGRPDDSSLAGRA